MSPTTQVVILAALLGHDVNDASLTQLAERYQVAIMSMSRAFDELEALELARPHRVGRQRRLSLRLVAATVGARSRGACNRQCARLVMSRAICP